MVLEQFTENLDETAKARQEARGILSEWNILENCISLVFWSVVIGMVSPDKHKAAEHKYGFYRSCEAHQVIE